MSKLKLGFGLFVIFTTQWIHAEEYQVGFAVAKPPFVYAMQPGASSENRGIELEIIHAAFAEEDITFTPHYFWRDKLIDELIGESVDAVSGVRAGNDKLFYSDSTVYFQNYAITHMTAKPINSLQELAGRNVVAWGGAAADLGAAFQAVIPKMTKFTEIIDQKNQVENFLNGSFDTIVIDAHIFKYYSLKHGVDPNHFSYNHIFGERTEFVTGFRDEALRDRFNTGLKKIKGSGDYDKIFHDHFDNK